MTVGTAIWSPSERVVILQAVPVIGTSTNYASGDLIGDLLELKPASGGPGSSALQARGGGVIESVGVVDLAKQDIQIDVFFWHTNPSNTTFTDNAAFDPAAADEANALFPVVPITNYSDAANSSRGWATANNLGGPMIVQAGHTLWAAMVARGAYNAASASDLQLRVGLLPL